MGWTSLLNDASSELLYPVLPLFLTVTLGAPAAAVGAVEGAAEATSQVVGLAVGRRSDQIRRRMPFVWVGYTLSNIAKPLVAVAPAWGWVLGARVLDRTGKGVRTAPRDALLRDSSEPGQTGSVFGFHRFMDSLGAVIGPLLALALLAAGLSLRQVLAYALYNTIYSGLSWPLGSLSDRIGKRRVLAAGLLVFAAVYGGFALATDDVLVWPLMAVYGVYMASTDGVGKALVSDLSPAAERATGQGMFKLATGGASVVASLVAGVLWQAVAPAAVFVLGAGAALLGLVALAATPSVGRNP